MVHDCVESNYLSYLHELCMCPCNTNFHPSSLLTIGHPTYVCFDEDFEGVKPRPVSYSVPYCYWICIILAFMVMIFIAGQFSLFIQFLSLLHDIINRKIGIMAPLHLVQILLFDMKYLTQNLSD